MYPAAAAAGLIGAFIGWLVFGWASRRLEKRHRILRAVAILAFALTMALWWLPILETTPIFIADRLSKPHARGYPLWELLGQPRASSEYLAGWVSALLVMAIAALPSRRAGAAAKTQVPAG